MRRIVVALLFVVLGLQVAGCGTPAPQPTEVAPLATPTQAAPAATPTSLSEEPTEEPVAEQVLRVGISVDVSNLDGMTSGLVGDWAPQAHIYSALLDYEIPSGKLICDLCTDWDVSDDGLVYTFNLREGVQFHKGYGQFTAEDVKYTYERHVAEGSTSQYVAKLQVIDEIEVVDAYTVRFKLKEPSVPFPNYLAQQAGSIVSKEAVEEFGEDYARNPVGTGPYVFDHWIEKTEVVLLKNPDYWGDPPNLDKLIFIPIPDNATREMALESGDVDVIEVSDPTAYERFEADPNITVKKVPGTMYCSIGINTLMEPLDDVKVRQALAYAINKDEIIEYVLAGVATKADVLLGPLFLGYTEDAPVYDYNPDLARQLLSEAGYPDGFETTITYPPGAGYGYFHKAMLAVQEDWAEVGVKLNIETVDGPTWFQLTQTMDMPMSYLGAPGPPEDDIALWWYFDEEAAQTFTGYTGLQDLLDAGRVELDPEEREVIYETILKQINQDLPAIPLFIPNTIIATRDYVKGMEPDVMRWMRTDGAYIEAH